MQELTEGSGTNELIFEFPEDWTALKYDKESGFYKQQVSKCLGTKAVDFLILEPNRQTWVEVKNFRGYDESNRIRLDSNESNVVGLGETRHFVNDNAWRSSVSVARKKLFIADEIAQKVKDTCAGLYGASLSNENTLHAFSLALQNKIPIHVVLFLQQDEELDQQYDFRRMALRIADKIKQQLVFINVTVEVVNQYTLSTRCEWQVTGND